MKEITKEWLKYAEIDLGVVRKIIASPELIDSVAFHLQQAVEKIIKAYIFEKLNVEPPKIHNLISLIEMAKIELSAEQTKIVIDLNYIYLETRYPANYQEIQDYFSKENINGVYDEIEGLVAWIKNKL